MKPDKKIFIIAGVFLACAAAVFAVIMHPDTFFSAMGKIFSAFGFLITGICLAYVLNIPMRAMEKHLFKKLSASPSAKKRRAARAFSLILTFIGFFGIIALSVAVIIPGFVDAIKNLAADAQRYADTLSRFAEDYSGKYEKLVDALYNLAVDNAVSIKTWITERGAEIVSAAAGAASSAVGGVTDFIMGIVVSVYILADKEHLSAGVKKSINAIFSEKIKDRISYISKRADASFSGFITGQLTEAFILGSLCFIGMLILRIPYAGIVSFIIGLASLIPVVGALTGGAVSAFLILMSSPLKAVIFVVFLLVLQLIEGNAIYPKVVGGNVGLPGLLVLSAVLIGGSLGGIMGVLFGVPLCSLMYTLYKDFINRRTSAKPEPASDE